MRSIINNNNNIIIITILFCFSWIGTLSNCKDYFSATGESCSIDTIMAIPSGRQLATVAGGCFWCIEAVYSATKGVDKAISGYMGGQMKNANYKAVCEGKTGHAEVVQVTFDPNVLSYPDLLEIFWKVHDPTTKDRQGNDIGTQYRSAIFYHNEEQKRIAELSKAAAEEAKLYKGPFVTEISLASTFYPAESYHQDYYKNNPSEGYCRAVVGPKLQKFKQLFREKLKEDAEMEEQRYKICSIL